MINQPVVSRYQGKEKTNSFQYQSCKANSSVSSDLYTYFKVVSLDCQIRVPDEDLSVKTVHPDISQR